jgi:hypothetical protein
MGITTDPVTGCRRQYRSQGQLLFQGKEIPPLSIKDTVVIYFNAKDVFWQSALTVRLLRQLPSIREITIETGEFVSVALTPTVCSEGIRHRLQVAWRLGICWFELNCGVKHSRATHSRKTDLILAVFVSVNVGRATAFSGKRADLEYIPRRIRDSL